MGPRSTREEIMNPVSKARAPKKVPRARSPHHWATLRERRATPGMEGSLRTCRRQRPVSPLAGNGWVRARGSPEPRHPDRGKVSWGRSRAEPNSQGPGRSGESFPPGRGRARADGEGHPGRYLLLDLPVLRDDPVRGGEGPSSCHTQQGGKAEEPAWTGARRQLAPAADPYCHRHLAPPPGPATCTGSGSGPPPFAILSRSTLEEEELRGCRRLTSGFLRFCLGDAEALPQALSQFGFRSETAFLLLFSSARYALVEWEPEKEREK